MNEFAGQPSIGALRTLGRQFDALESSGAEAGPVVGWRQWAVAGLCALAVVAVGFSPPTRALADRLAELIGIETPAPPPSREANPGVDTHLEMPSAELVRTCEGRLRSAPADEACLTVVLLASGDLAPGDYTNEEFDRAFERALARSGRAAP
ncbi:MAG: hypothetical protein QOI10_1591 [Solirubrobacterales bacterium]|jgi:hypothetical protein|nr:hypothetical protein [Solirubrobacterales bacterium]